MVSADGHSARKISAETSSSDSRGVENASWHLNWPIFDRIRHSSLAGQWRRLTQEVNTCFRIDADIDRRWEGRVRDGWKLRAAGTVAGRRRRVLPRHIQVRRATAENCHIVAALSRGGARSHTESTQHQRCYPDGPYESRNSTNNHERECDRQPTNYRAKKHPSNTIPD